ncbi:NAD(P)-binding protein [Myriangium duriaei CBS 260.36]|uniref:NAD(P)-binding protein n=1 Tax=Myriangium duriaei CBS 260.36 TaxID=1168546 RepID=A0A9P4IYZ7_9PEZI|nr:NAD(P)-binding protein [Myriangium duriaei CBS 260.36]
MFPPLLSIDALYLFATRVFGPPFWLALFFGLYLRHATPFLIYTSGLIAALTSTKYLLPLLETLQYGSPRHVDFSSEIVVITGGSRGLGRVLTELLVARGARVAVLDVVPFGEAQSVMFIATDVGDVQAVLDAQRRILGVPTTLINNAGIVNGKALLELSSAEVEQNFRVNLLSHFHTIRAFLPKMLTLPHGGTVVTVSSVLGELGAAQLSDYTAAKAGMIAMHASLRAELDAAGNDRIKTLLIKPGQLSTPLFKDVETPSSFFGPVVGPIELAKRIVERIEAGQSGVIALPLYAAYIEWMSVLPYAVQGMLRKLSGMDQAMQTFKPR